MRIELERGIRLESEKRLVGALHDVEPSVDFADLLRASRSQQKLARLALFRVEHEPLLRSKSEHGRLRQMELQLLLTLKRHHLVTTRVGNIGAVEAPSSLSAVAYGSPDQALLFIRQSIREAYAEIYNDSSVLDTNLTHGNMGPVILPLEPYLAQIREQLGIKKEDPDFARILHDVVKSVEAEFGDADTLLLDGRVKAHISKEPVRRSDIGVTASEA